MIIKFNESNNILTDYGFYILECLMYRNRGTFGNSTIFYNYNTRKNHVNYITFINQKTLINIHTTWQ